MNPLSQLLRGSNPQSPIDILRGVRDLFLNHPERYVENWLYANEDGSAGTSWSSSPRCCALGAVTYVASRDDAAFYGVGAEAVELLAAELPRNEEELAAVLREWGGRPRPRGINRGWDCAPQRVATCSNLLGPEFIAAKCECAIRKLEAAAAGNY